MLRLVFPFPSLWRTKNPQEWSKNCGFTIPPRFFNGLNRGWSHLNSQSSYRYHHFRCVLIRIEQEVFITNSLFLSFESENSNNIYRLSVRSVNDSLNYRILIGLQTSVRFLAKTGYHHQADERFPFLIEFRISETLNRNALVIL